MGGMFGLDLECRIAAGAFVMTVLGGTVGASAQATRGFYITTGVGFSSGAATETAVSGINHPTRCDKLLYANPADAPTDAQCTDNTSRPGGAYVFDPEAGLGGSLAVGYGLGALSVEIEALQRHQLVQEAPLALSAEAGAALTGKDTEWSASLPPWGDISEFRGRQLFVNLYYELANATRWTPYLGIGGGISQLDFRQYLGFTRKSIAEGYLEVFGGSRTNPDAAPEWQRAAAGTISQLAPFVSERGFGYHVLGGLDYTLLSQLSLGVKGRWVRIPDIGIDAEWSTVRSHAPVHVDGVTPFVSRLDFAKLGYLAATASLKYRF